MGDSRRGPSSTPQSRKIMVIADPTRESPAALQYALSHAVLEQDELILVHVENNGGSWKNAFSSFLRLPSSSSSSTSGSSPGANVNANIANTVSSLASEIGQGEGNFLEQMKRICEIAQPKVRVQTECITMDGIKAAAILLHGDKLGVEVIIIGQRRTISSSLLGSMRPGGSLIGSKGVDTAEYLIENSKCTCVGVQKKGQNGGYVLNTKTHKNFWLLA
uniref:UspA domain-containing protein n=1 Tax=Brassica campestris TaxID=3711 RepID=M4EV77_BRACM